MVFRPALTARWRHPADAPQHHHHGLSGYLRNMPPDTKRSIDVHVIDDSTTERDFADALGTNDGVLLYAKLPSGFKVPTPLGPYNPD